MSAVKKGIQELKGKHEKLVKITERYMMLMAHCISDSEFREEFERSPREALVDFVGMKIPEDATIVLDPYGPRWPIASFLKETEEEKVEVTYTEGPLSITENIYDISGVLKRQVGERKTDGGMGMSIPIKRDECGKMVVVMPYFTFETDLLTEYKFEGSSEAELILSSC